MPSSLWRRPEPEDSLSLRVLRFAILGGGVQFLCVSAVLYLDWEQQLIVALLTLGLAFWINRSSQSHFVTLTLMLLSIYSTVRYAFWRVTSAIAHSRDPGTNLTRLDTFFIWALLLAEGYAVMVLLLGYLQTLSPLKRTPVPLPNDPDAWPAVDLLIPTLDEPLSVVRYTALAAMNIDWPVEKLNVYILDDGRRGEFRAFAEEAGIGYMTRDDHTNAKAGNINHALERLDSPFVAVFDCDHIPTRSFLQLTMGWFLRDTNLAMMQTPHHFYSPDPFERNLDRFRAIPAEGELFYGVVQDGNDFWNATLFCGSCAVLRRSALDQVGGVAVETVTEDAHTSLRLQMKGWNTAYINIPQSAGLATERLSAHVKQRIRWARGMVQILRIENPLFARGLKPAQRLCYFNAMTHFLYALPRLIFLTAPLIYLIFGMTNIPGFWAAIVVYAVPHLVMSNLTNSRIQGRHRHSFWDEIYETVLAPFILLPTLLALISPRRGSFNTTAKGGIVDRQYFDTRIAWPFLMLLGFNCFGLLCAVARLYPFPTFHAPLGLAWLVNWPARLYDGSHVGTICVNVLWTLFNVTILGVATGVAWESQQRRRAVRLAMAVPSDVILADGSMIQGVTSDLSSGGVRTTMDRAVKAQVGDRIQFVFPVLDGTATLPATVMAIDGSDLRAKFDLLTLPEDEALTTILYSRADSWLGWGEAREPDKPLRSMGRILKLALRSLKRGLNPPRGGKRDALSGKLLSSIAPVFALVLLTSVWPMQAYAAQAAGSAGAVAQVRGPSSVSAKPAANSTAMVPAGQTTAAQTGGSATAGTFDHVYTLADLGAPQTIILQGLDVDRSIYFSLPRNQSVKTATMNLRYHLSPGLLPGISHLNLSINGKLFATLPVTAATNANQGGLLQAALTLPADALAHDNQLRIEFIGHYTPQCEDPANSTLWSYIDYDSTIELAGSLAPPADDLSVLPQPFYDNGVNLHPVVPIVFLSQPSVKAMQAAGIIASWIGILNGSRPVQFPVSVTTIPAGNAIVIAEDASQIPASLNVLAVQGATVAMRTNPSDPSSKLLLVTGGNADEVLTAAMALTLHGDTWQDSQVTVRNFTPPLPRRLDDAPRWLSTDATRVANLGQIAEAGAQFGDHAGDAAADFQRNGSLPVAVSLRVPPDLYFGDTKNLAFHLSYRYNGIPLGNDSTLQVYVNGSYVSSTPMPHRDKASAALETVVPIPVADLRPFLNAMTMQFAFQVATAGGCPASPPLNLQGAILRDSYLDIADVRHMTVLPNLQLFANAGYPFTRKADLADTSVVLPDQPSTDEIGMFLAMMGHFGAQTGYPAVNVEVTNAAGMTRDGKKDYLVMGTVTDQPALKMLDTSLPIGADETALHIRDTDGFFDRRDWWHIGSQDMPPSGQFDTSGGMPDALIEGIEWPARSSRSVVLVVLHNPAETSDFITAFLKSSQSSDIAQSVSVLHGDRFSSYRVGSHIYRIGDLSTMTRLTMIFQRFPWLVTVVTVLICFPMAILIQAILKKRAQERLAGEG